MYLYLWTQRKSRMREIMRTMRRVSRVVVTAYPEL